MEKGNLQDLINKDHLKEAIELLIAENEKGKKAKPLKLLKGRLVDLNRQNNQGTISVEAYNLEKNKIRAALLDIYEQDDHEATASAKSKFGYLPLLIGVFLAIGVLGIYMVNRNSKTRNLRKQPEVAATIEDSNKSKDNQVITTEAALPTKESKKAPSIEEIRRKKANEIALALKTKDLNFTTSEISLSEERVYKSGLATLKRKYEWETEIVVNVKSEDINVAYEESTKMIKITVAKASLSPAVVTKNQRSRTILNSLWIEETSKDGEFWQHLNQVTKAQINRRIKSDPSKKERVKETIDELIRKAISDFNQKEIVVEVERLDLYSGESLKY